MHLAEQHIAFGWMLGGASSEPPEANSSLVSPNGDALEYDAERVIAGDPVCHDFLIDNSSSEPIEILSDADIRLNCGCSSLVPINRRIEPKSRTHVRVKIETRGKRGRFGHGGTIVWTAPSGAKRTISLILRGEAVPPVECNPETIRFDVMQPQKEQVTSFSLGANVPVEWASLKWESSSPHVHVVESKPEENSLRCQAKCVLPESLEILQGTLTGHVKASEGSSPFLTFTVPFRAEQTVDFVVVPQTVLIAFQNGERGTARLLVRGELVGGKEPCIRAIHCKGFTVKWNLSKPTPSKRAVVELSFEPMEKTGESRLNLALSWRRVNLCFCRQRGLTPAWIESERCWLSHVQGDDDVTHVDAELVSDGVNAYQCWGIVE